MKVHSYGTAQFKLDKTRVRQVLNTTRFSFCTRASMRMLARSMTQKLSSRALVYALDVCTIICTSTRACKERTHLGVYTNYKPSITV